VNTEATGNRRVSYQQVDLSDWQSVASLARRIVSSHTRLDVLVNNAGKHQSQSSNQSTKHLLTAAIKKKIMKATTKGMDIQNKLTAYTIPCTYKLAK